MSFFQRMKESLSQKTEAVTQKFIKGLSKTSGALMDSIQDLFSSYRKIDDDFYEELEEILIQADVGVPTTMKLIEQLQELVKEKKLKDPQALQPLFIELIDELLDDDPASHQFQVNENGLTIYLFVGVNGVGKTTTIGKLAHQLKKQQKKVILAAGDTFRAGAIEQLDTWGKRIGVDVIKQTAGSDPAAVIYDGIQAAKARKADVLLCDTAGRLQNKVNLMEELKKILRVIRREVPDAPHEVLLVLDATTGQNALQQARTFGEAVDVSGIVLTKLDGTAKGGIVIAIKQELGYPVKLVGLGEQADDLQPFNSTQFLHALFQDLIEQESQDLDEVSKESH